MKLEFSRLILKNTPVSDFTKLLPVGAVSFHSDRQTLNVLLWRKCSCQICSVLCNRLYIWSNEIGRDVLSILFAFRVLFFFPPFVADWNTTILVRGQIKRGPSCIYNSFQNCLWLEIGDQNLWNFECVFCQCVVSISQSFVKSVQNAKFSLLCQTAGEMLNTTSQLLTVRHTRPKAVRVQNTDRILTC